MKRSETEVTIHLYRKDEALASIRWAILSRNHTEAIFWTLELYDSNMEQDAIHMLYTVWLSRIGFAPGSLKALKELQDLSIADRDTWCQTIFSWCRFAIHDTTIFHILLRGASIPTDWKPRGVHSNDYPTLTAAFTDTLLRRKLLDAWYIARAMPPIDQWTVLVRIVETKESCYKEWLNAIQSSSLTDVEQRAAMCCVITLDPALVVATLGLRPSGTLPSELIDTIASWDAEDSLRKRRAYKVRYEAITHLCARSQQPISESNESDIQDGLEKTLLASPYWHDTISKSMATDLKRESFYDTFFPCTLHDIPDEWSRTDREKSHGRGLGKTEDEARRHFIHATIQRSETLGLWNSTLDSNTVSGTDWHTIYTDLYPICSEKLQVPIRAIQKEFVII